MRPEQGAEQVAEQGAGGARPSTHLDVGAFARALAELSAVAVAASWRPWLVRVPPDEHDRFAALCRAHGVGLVDELDRQLAELAAVRQPAASAEERQRFVASTRRAADESGESLGSWACFPWLAKAVRVLPPDDYFAVITDRNRNKITREEQLRLRGKRVGVLGLSVGGEAAVAVAQEHLCGEIVLADFDRLDLSNLNRLGAGVDELGVNKAILVARRIARLDPYLEVRLFAGGVTPDNLDDFLDGLDLLIEECDGLPVKHAVRQRARARGLNLVFAADERGFLSVEPYGDCPELRPFHGRIEAPQPPREAFPSPLAHMQALTEWMGGWSAISARSRHSLEEIGATVCGYPQLASEARYAAGQLGHVARRLLLGERVAPFIGHLDLDRLLAAPGASSGT